MYDEIFTINKKTLWIFIFAQVTLFRNWRKYKFLILVHLWWVYLPPNTDQVQIRAPSLSSFLSC